MKKLYAFHETDNFVEKSIWQCGYNIYIMSSYDDKNNVYKIFMNIKTI